MTAPAPSLEFLQLGARRNATNGSNDTAPGEPAGPVPDDSRPTPAVRLFGNPFHVHAELAPASPDALALLSDGSFAKALSFATQYSPTEADKVFCQTASHHLLHLHYEDVGFQHTEGRPEGKDYQDWCVEVCQYRHGETQICARPGNGTNATAANGTNATDAAAALVHQISESGLLRRMRMVSKD